MIDLEQETWSSNFPTWVLPANSMPADGEVCSQYSGMICFHYTLLKSLHTGWSGTQQAVVNVAGIPLHSFSIYLESKCHEGELQVH